MEKLPTCDREQSLPNWVGLNIPREVPGRASPNDLRERTTTTTKDTT